MAWGSDVKVPRLTREQILALMERCAQEDLSYRVTTWAYRTHTGDALSAPWTGSMVYEFTIDGTAPPSVLNRAFLRRIEQIAAEYGLTISVADEWGDDSVHGVRIVPRVEALDMVSDEPR